MKPYFINRKIFFDLRKKLKDPLTIVGFSIERITLLPLNYTRYIFIMVYKYIICRINRR
jgi:hypothetical protein